jgi:hypothetical protein
MTSTLPPALALLRPTAALTGQQLANLAAAMLAEMEGAGAFTPLDALAQWKEFR